MKEFESKNGLIVGSGDGEAKKGKLEYSDSRGGVYLHYDEEHKNLIGRETQAKCENITGVTIPKASVVKVVNYDTTFTVEKAIANNIKDAETTFGLTCCDLLHNDDGTKAGFVYKYGSLGGLDTSAFEVGDYLYLSDTIAGAFTNVKPKEPNYIVQIGIVAVKDAVDGVIGIEVVPFTNTDTIVNASGLLDGIITPQQKVEFINDGTFVYAEISNEQFPTENLPLLFGGVRYLLDTTTNTGTNGKARVQLANGLLNEIPQDNWIFVKLVGGIPTLQSSTTFPSGDYAWVGLATLKTISETISDGVFSFQRTNNAISVSDGDGLLDAITKRLRRMGASYISGVNPTVTLNTSTTPDSLKVSTSSGVVTQFREQNFDSIDGSVYYVVNYPNEPYKKITNLNQIDVTASGAPLTDSDRIGINLFALQSSTGTPDRLLVTLPLEVYSNDSACIYDYNSYAVTTIPSDVGSKYITFRVCRLALRYDTNNGGEWTNLLGDGAFQDERGYLLGTGSGGAGSNSRTDFDDASFYWFNALDPTKILTMNLNNLTTNTTKSITMVDDDLDLSKYPTKYIELENDGNTVLNNIEKYNKFNNQLADVSGFNYTDNGNGSVSISSGVVVFEHNDVIKSYNVNEVLNINLVDDKTNYILIDYNTNIPIIVNTITLPLIEDDSKKVIYSISRIGNTLTYVDLRFMNNNYSLKNTKADIYSNGLKHVNGYKIGQTGNRYLTISEGSFFIGNKNIITSSFNSTTESFLYTYRDNASGWNYISANQFSNTSYDDGTGTLATISNNKFGVHWVYSMLDSNNNEIILVQYGQGDYTESEAFDVEIPSITPEFVTNYSNVILVGRIVIKKDAITSDIESAFEVKFHKAGVTNHNALSNLDYASSGHTGFASSSELSNYRKLTNNSFTDDVEMGGNDINSAGVVNANNGTFNSLNIQNTSDAWLKVYGDIGNSDETKTGVIDIGWDSTSINEALGGLKLRGTGDGSLNYGFLGEPNNAVLIHRASGVEKPIIEFNNTKVAFNSNVEMGGNDINSAGVVNASSVIALDELRTTGQIAMYTPNGDTILNLGGANYITRLNTKNTVFRNYNGTTYANDMVLSNTGLAIAGVVNASSVVADDFNSNFVKSWTKSEVGSTIEFVLAITQLSTGRVLISTGSDTGDGDIYYSDNFGISWTKSEIGSTIEEAWAITQLSTGRVLIGTGNSTNDGDIYYSDDFGLTWTKSEIGSNIEKVYSITQLSTGRVLIGTGSSVGDGDVYYSDDYGISWTKSEVGSNIESVWSISQLFTGRVLIGTGDSTDDGDVYYSDDFGLTWTKSEVGSAIERIYSIVQLSTGRVLIGTGINTGDGDIYYSDDFGLTWTKSEIESAIESIWSITQLSTGRVMIGTGSSTDDGDVYYSDDFGLTWTKSEIGSTIGRVFVITQLSTGRVMIGTGSSTDDGDVYYSDDISLIDNYKDSYENLASINKKLIGQINSLEARLIALETV